jgi:aerobic C4-dicarboxylate transport protein
MADTPVATDQAPTTRRDRTHWLYIAVVVAVVLGIVVGLSSPTSRSA